MSSGDALKSSADVWGGGGSGEGDTIVEAPPAYSGIDYEGASSSQPDAQTRPDLPSRQRRKPVPREPYHPVASIAKWAKIPWSRYIAPEAVVSADRTTITTTHPQFWTSQQALIKLLADQAEIPPIPSMRITGNTNLHSNGVADIFDITLNLSSLLDLTATPRWHVKPAQVVPLQNASGRSPATFEVHGNDAAQIQSLTRQFLKDRSDRKSFVLSRTVDNIPTDIIEGLVRNLIASIHYRGRLNIAFPVQSSKLIIQKRPAGTGAAVGGWFMNVLGLSPDVKYETLERVWSIGRPIVANSAVDADNDQEGGDSVDHGEASALIKEWWNAWAPVIRDAILLKRHGKVGIEDWMETQMGWRPQAPTRDWGVGYSP